MSFLSALTFQEVLDFISANITGIIMMVILIGAGIFFTVRTRALQFRRFGFAFKSTVGGLFKKNQHSKEKGAVSPFQAMTTALAGTIGTGSIAGVATALVAGGPGAVFWMWISALLGMVTKYCEIVLSLKYREKNKDGAWVGGPMYYIKNGLGKKWLAILFAIFAAIACIATGNLSQSNAISGVINTAFNVPMWVTSLVVMVLVGLVLIGGIKSIASVNEKLVPSMAVFFLLCAIAALIVQIEHVPNAFKLIFTEAFNFRAGVGGVAGYGVLTAMRYGVGRGVFTNEAGLGSAPIAHAASSEKDPVKQGWWGMFEVFITTIIICTMSALVILTSGAYQGLDSVVNGAALSSEAFNEALPYVGKYGVAIATVFFSLSTILGWAYYGEVSVGYIFSKHSKTAIWIYRAIFVLCAFVGGSGFISLEAVWTLADIFNVFMALPNIVALVILSKQVIDLTTEHLKKHGRLSKPNVGERNLDSAGAEVEAEDVAPVEGEDAESIDAGAENLGAENA